MPEAVEIVIPELGESVSEGVIAHWLKNDGDVVETDESLLELETDKAMLEIPSQAAGRLEILVEEGETVGVGDVIAKVHPGETPEREVPDKPQEPEREGEHERKVEAETETEAEKAPEADKRDEPMAARVQAPAEALSPAVRKLLEEHGLDPSEIEGTGKDGRLTKADVLRHLEARERAEQQEPTEVAEERVPTRDEDDVRRERMSQLRLTVARRLVEVRQQAAILTTFNDIDMTQVVELRKRYRDEFERKHGVRLGYMSLFSRACVLALHEIPRLNAFIDGEEIVYHKHVHLGIAVSTERGLVVPVIQYADTLKLHELEQKIDELARKAREVQISPDELSGGTFSITNGGVFGSLLSTPILNPPQSGILGMHRIEERPVAIEGKVEVRPMMYVALSYDHRIVDGREAVTFLRHVKEYLEDPRRMVLEI